MSWGSKGQPQLMFPGSFGFIGRFGLIIFHTELLVLFFQKDIFLPGMLSFVQWRLVLYNLQH